MNRMNNCNYRPSSRMGAVPMTVTSAHRRNDMLEGLPLAMGYVPKQHYNQMFDLGKGFRMGTIFPELCLPFCGMRRNCTCRIMK